MSERPVDEHLETILRLAFVAEFRDSDTNGHLLRVSELSRLLAEQLGWPAEQAARLAKAAPMHDIGKVAIPDQILLKPGALTHEEREVMQQHTSLGARLLLGSDSPVLTMGEEICRTHHEHWDGHGYPEGLAGDAIPMCGRIVALVDVYDALVTRRVYKPAMSPDEAVETLREAAGAHFDPLVVQAFFDLQDAVARVYEELGDSEDDEQWVV